ncbi:DeoR/GlpR family DNA-binding transcription regulator [Klebsiella michiganensis]|nr:DeoR/GlpR family DNA-binding transcription regulator [Klebsiella michiganensis]
MDCGTTPLALAHFIFDKKIMVITNSIPVVNLLKGRKNIKLIVAPGEYEDASQGMVSFSTADFFRHIHADKVFLSTQGVNDLGELTVPEMTDAHVKQALMRAGRQKILLADSSKFGQTFLAGHARLADLDLVISQTGLSPDILSLMQTQNVPLLLADSHL